VAVISWVIAVPAWGERYMGLFLGPALRSHVAAIARLSAEFRGSIRVRYVVQTDQPEEVARRLAPAHELTLLPPPPPGAPYLAFAEGHRAAIESARDDERVCLMNADMLMSVEALAAAEARFRMGKRAIITCGTRTIAPLPPRRWSRKPFGPPPMRARDLHAWSMAHAHPVTRQCFWGEGKCHLPWGVYFQEGENIVLRAFHMHPFAVVKDRPLPFKNTVDLEMVDHFSRAEMHVVTDADEMADNEWPIDETAILSWALRGAGPTHWWNFSHRICIAGDPALVSSDASVAAACERLNPYQGKEAAA
jgi:hypothetical protein